MKFNELLLKLESTSPLRTMYHATPLNSAKEIAVGGEYNLTRSDNDGARMKEYPAYRYFMSTARTPASEYVIEVVKYSSTPVIIELDASKLSDQYKIVPFNWHKNRDKWHEDLESEDRVLSKSSKIPNFLNYIKAFHINDYFNHEKIVDRLMTIKKVNQLIDSGKPVYMYNTINDLMILNRTKRKLLQSHIS